MYTKDIVVTLKIPLFPTEEQKGLFFKMYCCYHNLGNKIVEFMKDNSDIYSETDIRNELAPVLDDYTGLSSYFLLNKAVKEKSLARKQHGINKLRFKKFSRIRQTFPVRCDSKGKRLSRIYSDDNDYIKIPSIPDKVKISNQWLGKYKNDTDYLSYLLNMKKQEARIVFDGKYWFLIYAYDLKIEVDDSDLKEDVLGIDLGISTQFYMSDGDKHEGVNKVKSEYIDSIELKIKHLQEIVSRKRLINNHKITNNIKKLERRIYLLQRKLKSIRLNELHLITNKIIEKGYRYIAMEDLDIQGMLSKYKNKDLHRNIARQCWYLAKTMMRYKTEVTGQEVIDVNRYYPSSRVCSFCLTVKDNLSLQDRLFVCDECGLEIDRDYNASLNIKDYASRVIYGW